MAINAASLIREKLRREGVIVKPKPEPLLDWCQRMCPELDRFDYFGPYADALEQCVGAGLRLAFAAPPQHGKTLLTLLAFLWLSVFFPGRRHAYVTFNETRAQEVAKDFRRLAMRCGIEVLGTLQKMELPGGTTIKFTSVKGDLTGSPVDGVCVIDDPIKNAIEARSAAVRRDAIEWWKSVARSRRHQGTSYIAMATRWHERDLTGHLVAEEDWTYLNFKAIAEPENDNDVSDDGRVKSDPILRYPGESLCPSRKPPEFFAEERKDKFWWYAMYQGKPQPIGGTLFREPARYTKLPEHGYRVAYGLDLAYTEKTHADWSVAIELWMVPDADPRKTVFYVVDLQAKQVEAPSFALTLRAMHAKHAGRFWWYASGTEKGSAQFFAKQGIPVEVMDTRGRDKLMRAQETAAAWNDGRIMVPADHAAYPWVDDFVEEMVSFTGVRDLLDNRVDALVGGYDGLVSRSVVAPKVQGIGGQVSSQLRPGRRGPFG